MTRPKPIRMNPNRLPPLTKAQTERVKLFRKQFKDYGKVSVIRKGQKPGHILISVIGPDRVDSFSYGPDGYMVDRWSQNGLPLMVDLIVRSDRNQTNPYGDT